MGGLGRQERAPAPGTGRSCGSVSERRRFAPRRRSIRWLAVEPNLCEECGAPTTQASCAELFDRLLALDHSRQQPWGALHGEAVACYFAQHPSAPRAPRDVAPLLQRLARTRTFATAGPTRRLLDPTARPVRVRRRVLRTIRPDATPPGRDPPRSFAMTAGPSTSRSSMR